MNRLADEAEYVLAVLQQTRDEVTANPTLFESDAIERIDKAITHFEGVTREVLAA
jgi:hypothetical protein